MTTNEPQVNLTDAHYDRLEGILTERIQAHVQTGTLFIVEYRLKICSSFLSNGF